jgi:putative transposase
VLRRPVESAQYTSLAFGRRLTDTGLVASMGTIGDALDNAVAESFFATLECELLDRHDWPTRQALRTAVFDFIEVFYNRQRRHSTLDYASPATYERQHTSPAPACHRQSKLHPPCCPEVADGRSAAREDPCGGIAPAHTGWEEPA